jgi:UDP-glucuronate decarboxylase
MGTRESFVGPLNLGNPFESSIKDLAEIIIRLTGSHSELVFKPLPSDDPLQRQPDISLAKKMLKWEPVVDLEQGLISTIEYFDTRLSRHFS